MPAFVSHAVFNQAKQYNSGASDNDDVPYHGKAQSRKSNALGTADEQRPANGNGNR